MPGCSSICLLVAALTLGAESETRTFTDTQGKKLTGSFVQLEGDNVTIKMESGNVTFDLNRLSISDRLFVRAEARKLAEQAAAGAETASDASDSQGVQPLKIKRVPVEERQWTDSQGRTIRAKFIRLHNGNVVLQSRTIATVPFAGLSADDQQYVRELMESRGEGDQVPQVIAAEDNNNGAPNDNVAGAPDPRPSNPVPGNPFPGAPTFSNPGQAANQAMEDAHRRMEEMRATADRNRQEMADRLAEQQRQQEEERLQRQEADRVAMEQRREESRQQLEEQARQRQEQLANSSSPTTPQHIAPPNIPAMPDFSQEEGYVCESCNHDISQQEAGGERCPYCHIYWNEKPAELPQPTKSSSWDFSGTRITGRGIKGLIGLAVLIVGGVIRFFMYLGGSSSENN